jgi:hypothetical protein
LPDVCGSWREHWHNLTLSLRENTDVEGLDIYYSWDNRFKLPHITVTIKVVYFWQYGELVEESCLITQGFEIA